MAKMIVTDLDDTLFRCDKTISEYTARVLKGLRQQGMKIVYATARGDSAKLLVPDELFDGHVRVNGAKAHINGRVVYERTIPPDVYTPYLRELSRMGLKVAAEIHGTHYANFKVDQKWPYIKDFIITDCLGVTGPADKLYALIESPYQIEVVTSLLPEKLYVNLARDALAMIMHKEATKLRAITKIAQEFNIAIADVITFGDDINDKEMLQGFGLGVAMGNAIDEIQSIADCVCDTNDNDGVAKWLDEYFVLD